MAYLKRLSVAFIIVAIAALLAYCTNQALAAYAPPPQDEMEWAAAFSSPNIDRTMKRDIGCLTEAIYFEAVGEPEKGKLAVAYVIINRANWNGSGDNLHRYEFSDSICGVVQFAKQYKHRKVCAFSYRCERGFKRKLTKAQKRDSWKEIKQLATYAYLFYSSDKDMTEGATFYHADYVRPRWASHYERTSKIGRHIFYRIPG